ncbi:Uncharacterised protein [Vibrio cholerae]|nr:Uncharacterised protein [Vibrio cholerae]
MLASSIKQILRLKFAITIACKRLFDDHIYGLWKCETTWAF